MGVDLVLLPMRSMESNASDAMLYCERREELFKEIAEISSSPAKEGVICYLARSWSEDNQTPYYGLATEDDYGEPLRKITVGDLLQLSSHEGVRDNFKNRAIWRFLAEYPANWPVVLFWT